MKKITKILSIILALTLVVTAFAGCTSHSSEQETVSEPLALSIALGFHQGFPEISLNNKTLSSTIERACESYGDISAFAIGGKAAAIGDYKLVRSDKNLTQSKIKSIAKKNAVAVSNSIADFDYSRIEPETNPLAAINACANTLAMSEHDERILLVFDSGLTTAGVLGNSNVLDANPQAVVRKLKEIHALPNLDGVKVIWVGLGQTAGKQSAVPTSYKHKLQEMWTAIIEASNGTVVFDTTDISGKEVAGLPNVSTIDFPVDSLEFTADDLRHKTIKLSEDDIKFSPNSSKFINEAAASDTLKPVAEFLSSDPANKIIIAGTTASAGGDGLTLSQQRAASVKSILVKNYGVDSNQIKTIGLGCTNNILHVDDLDKNGNLIETEAKKNRSIYIFSPESNTARSLNL